MGLLDSLKNTFARRGDGPRARLSGDDLFDDDFQRKLDYLAIVSRRVFAGRMRAERRTTLSVNDIAVALRALDVEPLYGYDSTRPLRYGEASMGPGQPLFYIEDEEVDFEKLINAPLPKVPRDANFTGMLARVTAEVEQRLGAKGG